MRSYFPVFLSYLSCWFSVLSFGSSNSFFWTIFFSWSFVPSSPSFLRSFLRIISMRRSKLSPSFIHSSCHCSTSALGAHVVDCRCCQSGNGSSGDFAKPRSHAKQLYLPPSPAPGEDLEPPPVPWRCSELRHATTAPTTQGGRRPSIEDCTILRAEKPSPQKVFPRLCFKFCRFSR